MTRICPSCGAEVPAEADFCPSCGEFLDWETPAGSSSEPAPRVQPAPTGSLAPDEEARRAEGADAPAAAAPVLVLLGTGEAVEVEPGSSATVSVQVGTGGSRVDEIRLHLEGSGASFAEVTPSLTIYPGDNSTVEIVFTPPRGPQVGAGTHEWVLVATSIVHGNAASRLAGLVKVAAFVEGSADLHPRHSSGRGRHFQHHINVANEGNKSWTATLQVEDADGLHVHAPTSPFVVAPGQRVEIPLPVDSPRIWFGAPRSLPFQVDFAPASDPGPGPQELQGVRTQRALLPLWLIPAALAVVGLVVAALTLLNRATVPDVGGLSVALARQSLENAGFDISSVTEVEPSETVDKGSVTRTEPAAGAQTRKGATVTLFTSLGREIPVPDVTKLAEGDARARLKAEGFVPVVAWEESSELDRGLVTRTDPPAQAKLAEGERITVYVSPGPKAVNLPDLTDLPLTEATKRLDELKLTYNTNFRYSTKREKDHVMRTDPPKNTPVTTGEQIQLYVSLGYYELEDMAGRTMSDAREYLSKEKFLEPVVEEQFSETVAPGNVISTREEVGTHLAWGDSVTLYVSKGPADPVELLLGKPFNDQTVTEYLAQHAAQQNANEQKLDNGVTVVTSGGEAAIVAGVVLDDTYVGALPQDLRWGMTPEEVSSIFGEAVTPPTEFITGRWDVDRPPIAVMRVWFDSSTNGARQFRLFADEAFAG